MQRTLPAPCARATGTGSLHSSVAREQRPANRQPVRLEKLPNRLIDSDILRRRKSPVMPARDRVQLVRYACLVSYIFKLPVTKVVIQSCARGFLFSLHGGKGGNIQEVNIR